MDYEKPIYSPDASGATMDSDQGGFDMSKGIAQLAPVAPTELTAASKLALKVTNAKKALQDQKRQQDSLIMPTILEDIKQNENRMNEIRTQVEKFEYQNQAINPQRTIGQLDQADLIAAGLGMIVGGPQGGNQAFRTLMGQAQQRADIDFQNQTLKKQSTMQHLENLQRQLNQSQVAGDRLAAMRISELIRQEEAGTEADRFDTNTLLKMADDERQDVRIRKDSFNQAVMNLWKEGGAIPPEVKTVLETNRAKLIASGVEEGLLMPIPTGQTVRAGDVAADNTRADEALKHKKDLDWANFDERIQQFDIKIGTDLFKFGENQRRLKNEFTLKQKEFRAKVDSGYFTKNPRAIKSETDKTMDAADKALDNVGAQLGGVERELEAKRKKLSAMDLKAFGRYDLEKEIEKLEGERANLQGVGDHWRQAKRSILPPIEDVRAKAKAAGLDKNPDFLKGFQRDYGEPF